MTTPQIIPFDSPQTIPFDNSTVGSSLPSGSDVSPAQDGGIVGGIGNAVSSVGTGIASSLIGTAKGIGDILGLQPTPLGQQFLKATDSTDSGTLGKSIGNIIGTTAQFMAPGDAETAVFTKGAEYIDKLPKLLGLGEKAGIALVNALKISLRAGITGASTAGVTGLQTGGDPGAMEAAGLTGGVAGGLAESISSFGPAIAKSLNHGDFKLSPMQEAKAAQKANSAAQFITDNKILGTADTKYVKLSSINNDLENALQSSLPKTVSIPKSQIIANINANVEALINSSPAEYATARNEADQAIAILNKSQGSSINGSIDMETALNGKRSWGSQAFKNSSYAVKDARVSAVGPYAIEQGYQQALSDTLKDVNGSIKIPPVLSEMFGGATQVSIEDFNKVYSQAISAKNFTYLSQFKNDPGLFSKMFGVWIGQSAGNAIFPGPIGSVLGGVGGEIGSKQIPSLFRNLTERAMQSDPSTTVNVAKAGLGTFMPSKQGQ